MTFAPNSSRLSQNLWFHKTSRSAPSLTPKQPDLFQTQQLFDLQFPEVLCTFDHINDTPDTNPESTQISKLSIISVPPTAGDYSTYLLKNADSQRKSGTPQRYIISNNNTHHNTCGVLVPTKPNASSRIQPSVKITLLASSNGCRLESWFKQRLFYFPTSPNYLNSIENCPKRITVFTSSLAVCSNNTILLHYIEHHDPTSEYPRCQSHSNFRPNHTDLQNPAKPHQVMRCIRWFEHPDKRIVSCTAYSPTSVNNVSTNSNIIADSAHEKIRTYQTVLVKLHEHQLLNNPASSSNLPQLASISSSSSSPPTSTVTSPQQNAAEQTFGTQHATPPHIEALLDRINDSSNNLSEHAVVTIPAATQSSFNTLYNDAMLSSTDLTSPSNSISTSSPNASTNTRPHQRVTPHNPSLSSSARYQSEISTRLTPLVSHSTTTVNNHHSFSAANDSLQHLHSGFYYAVGCLDGSVYILPLAWMLGSSTSSGSLNDLSSALDSAISPDSSSHDHLALDRAPSLTKISSISHEHGQSKTFRQSANHHFTDENHFLLLPYQAHHPLLPIVVTSTYDKTLPATIAKPKSTNGQQPPHTSPIQQSTQLTTTSASQFTPEASSTNVPGSGSDKGSSKQSHYTTLSSILASASSISWKTLDTLHCWYLLDDILSPLLSHPMAPFQTILGTCDDHLITTLGSCSPLLDSFWWVPLNPYVPSQPPSTPATPIPSSDTPPKQAVKMTRSEYLYYRFSTLIYQQHRQHHIFVTLRDPTSTTLLQPPQPTHPLASLASPLPSPNPLATGPLSGSSQPQSSTPIPKQQILLQKPSLREHLREQIVLLSQPHAFEQSMMKSSVHNVISDSPNLFIDQIHPNSSSGIISTLFWTTRYGEIFIITLFENNILLFVNVINLKSFTLDLSAYVQDTPIKSIQLIYYDSNNNHNTNLPNNGTSVHTGACDACLDRIMKNSSTTLSTFSPLHPFSSHPSTHPPATPSVTSAQDAERQSKQNKQFLVPALSNAHSNAVSSSRSTTGVVLEMSDPLQHELIQAIKDNNDFELAQESSSLAAVQAQQKGNRHKNSSNKVQLSDQSYHSTNDDIYNESDITSTVHRVRTFSATNLPPSLTCLTCLLLLAQREISTQLLITTVDRQTYTITIESKLQLNRQQLDLFADIDPMLLRRGIRILDCYSRDFGLFSTSSIPSLGGKKHTLRHDIYLTSLKAKICGYVSPQVTSILDDRCLVLWSLGKQSINIRYKGTQQQQSQALQSQPHGSLQHNLDQNSSQPDGSKNASNAVHQVPLQTQSQLYSMNLMENTNDFDGFEGNSTTTTPSSAKSAQLEEQQLFDITPTQTAYLATQEYDDDSNTLEIDSKSEDYLFLQKYYLSLPFDYPLFAQEYDNLLRNTLQVGPHGGKEYDKPTSSALASITQVLSSATNPSSRTKSSYKAEDADHPNKSEVSNVGKRTITLQQLFLLIQSCHSMHFESILSTPFVTRVVQPIGPSTSSSQSGTQSSSQPPSPAPTPASASKNVTTSRLHTISLLSASLKHTPIICLSSSYYNNLVLPYSQQLYYQQQNDLSLLHNPSLPISAQSPNTPLISSPLSDESTMLSLAHKSTQLLTYSDIVIFSLLIGHTTPQSRTQLETAKLLDSLLQQLYPVITAQGKSQHAIPTWFEMPVLPILSPLLPKPIILKQLKALGLLISDATQASASSSSSTSSQSLKNPIPHLLSLNNHDSDHSHNRHSGDKKVGSTGPTTQHITNVQQLWPIYAIKWLDYNPPSFTTTTPTGTRITLITSSILQTQLASFFFATLTEYYQQIYHANGLQPTHLVPTNSSSSPFSSITQSFSQPPSSTTSIFQFTTPSTSSAPVEKSLHLPSGIQIARLLTLGKYPLSTTPSSPESAPKPDHLIPPTQFLLFLLMRKFIVDIKSRHVQKFFRNHLDLYPNDTFPAPPFSANPTDLSGNQPGVATTLTTHSSQHSGAGFSQLIHPQHSPSSSTTSTPLSQSPHRLTNHIAALPTSQTVSINAHNTPNSSLQSSFSNLNTSPSDVLSDSLVVNHQPAKSSPVESLFGANFAPTPPSSGQVSITTSTNSTNNNLVYVLPAADLMIGSAQPNGWNSDLLKQQLALYQNSSLCFFFSPTQHNAFYSVAMATYHALYGAQYLFDNSYVFVLDAVNNALFVHSSNHLYSRLFPYPEEQQDNVNFFFPSPNNHDDDATHQLQHSAESKQNDHFAVTNRFSPIVQQIQFPTTFGSKVSNIISVHSTRYPSLSPFNQSNDQNATATSTTKPSIVVQTTTGVYTLIPSSLQYRYQYLQQLLYKQHDSLLLSYLNSCSNALISPAFKSISLVQSLAHKFTGDIIAEYKFVIFKDVVKFYTKITSLAKCTIELINPSSSLTQQQYSTTLIKPQRPETVHQPLTTLHTTLAAFLDLEIITQLIRGTHLAPFPSFPSFPTPGVELNEKKDKSPNFGPTSFSNHHVSNTPNASEPISAASIDSTSQFNPFVLKQNQPSHHLNIHADMSNCALPPGHPHYLNFDQCILYTIYVLYNQLHDDISTIICNLTNFDAKLASTASAPNSTAIIDLLVEVNSVPTFIAMFSRLFVLIRRSSLRYNPLLVATSILSLISPLQAALSSLPQIPSDPNLTVTPTQIIKETFEAYFLGGLEVVVALLQEGLGARPPTPFPSSSSQPPLPSEHLLSKLGFFPLLVQTKSAISQQFMCASSSNFGLADLSLAASRWQRIRFNATNMINFLSATSNLATTVQTRQSELNKQLSSMNDVSVSYDSRNNAYYEFLKLTSELVQLSQNFFTMNNLLNTHSPSSCQTPSKSKQTQKPTSDARSSLNNSTNTSSTTSSCINGSTSSKPGATNASISAHISSQQYLIQQHSVIIPQPFTLSYTFQALNNFFYLFSLGEQSTNHHHHHQQQQQQQQNDSNFPRDQSYQHDSSTNRNIRAVEANEAARRRAFDPASIFSFSDFIRLIFGLLFISLNRISLSLLTQHHEFDTFTHLPSTYHKFLHALRQHETILKRFSELWNAANKQTDSATPNNSNDFDLVSFIHDKVYRHQFLKRATIIPVATTELTTSTTNLVSNNQAPESARHVHALFVQLLNTMFSLTYFSKDLHNILQPVSTLPIPRSQQHSAPTLLSKHHRAFVCARSTELAHHALSLHTTTHKQLIRILIYEQNHPIALTSAQPDNSRPQKPSPINPLYHSYDAMQVYLTSTINDMTALSLLDYLLYFPFFIPTNSKKTTYSTLIQQATSQYHVQQLMQYQQGIEIDFIPTLHDLVELCAQSNANSLPSASPSSSTSSSSTQPLLVDSTDQTTQPEDSSMMLGFQVPVDFDIFASTPSGSSRGSSWSGLDGSQRGSRLSPAGRTTSNISSTSGSGSKTTPTSQPNLFSQTMALKQQNNSLPTQTAQTVNLDDTTILLQAIDHTRQYISSYLCTEYTQLNFANVTNSLIFHFLQFASHIIGFRDESSSIYTTMLYALKKPRNSSNDDADHSARIHQPFHRFSHLEPMMSSIAAQIGPFLFLYYNSLNEPSAPSQNASPLTQFNFSNTVSRNTLFDILVVAIKFLFVFDIERQEYSTQLAQHTDKNGTKLAKSDDGGDNDADNQKHFTETQHFLASTWLHALSFDSPSFFDLNYQFNNLTINFDQPDHQHSILDKKGGKKQGQPDTQHLRMLREENKFLISTEEVSLSQATQSSTALSQQEQYQQQMMMANGQNSQSNSFVATCAFDTSLSSVPIGTRYISASSSSSSSSSSDQQPSSQSPSQQKTDSNPYLSSLLDVYSALTSTIPTNPQQPIPQSNLAYNLIGYGDQHNMVDLAAQSCKTIMSTHYDLALIRLGYTSAVKYDPTDSSTNQNQTYRIGTTTREHTSPKETIQMLLSYQHAFKATLASYNAQQLRLRYQQLTFEQQLKQQQQQTYPYSIRLTTTLLFFLSYIQQLIPSLSEDKLTSVILLLQPPALPSNITPSDSSSPARAPIAPNEDIVTHFLSTKQDEASELVGGLKGMNDNCYVPLSLDDEEVVELLFHTKNKAISTLFQAQTTPISTAKYSPSSQVSMQSSSCTCTHTSTSSPSSPSSPSPPSSSSSPTSSTYHHFGLHCCISAALSDCFSGRDLPLALSFAFSAAAAHFPCTTFDPSLPSHAKRNGGGYSLYNYLLLSTLTSHSQINLVEIYFSALISYVFKRSLSRARVDQDSVVFGKTHRQLDKLFGVELSTILPTLLLCYYGCYDPIRIQNQLLSFVSTLSSISFDSVTSHFDVVVKTKVLLLQAVLVLDLLTLRLDTIFDRLCELECLQLGLSELISNTDGEIDRDDPTRVPTRCDGSADESLLQTLVIILLDAEKQPDEFEQQFRLADMQFEVANYIEQQQLEHQQQQQQRQRSRTHGQEEEELEIGANAVYRSTLLRIFNHLQSITYLTTIFYPTTSPLALLGETRNDLLDGGPLRPQDPNISLFIIHQLLENPRMSTQQVIGLLYSTTQYYLNLCSRSALSSSITRNSSISTSLVVHTLPSPDLIGELSSEQGNGKQRQQQIDLAVAGYGDELVLNLMNKVFLLAQLFDYIASPLHTIYNTLISTLHAIPQALRNRQQTTFQHLQYFITNNTLSLEHQRTCSQNITNAVLLHNEAHHQHIQMYKEFFSSLLHWSPRLYSLLSPQAIYSTYGNTNNDDQTIFALSSSVISAVTYNTLNNVLIRSYFASLFKFFANTATASDRVHPDRTTINEQYQVALEQAALTSSHVSNFSTLLQASHYTPVLISDLTNTDYIRQVINNTAVVNKTIETSSTTEQHTSSFDCRHLLTHWLASQLHTIGYAIILSTMVNPGFSQRSASQHSLTTLFEIPYDTILHFLQRYQMSCDFPQQCAAFILPPTFFNPWSTLTPSHRDQSGKQSVSDCDPNTLQNIFYSQCIRPNTYASHLYRSMRKLTTVSPLLFITNNSTAQISHDLSDTFNYTYPIFSSSNRGPFQSLDSFKAFTQQIFVKYNDSLKRSAKNQQSAPQFSESLNTPANQHINQSTQRFLSLHHLNSPQPTVLTKFLTQDVQSIDNPSFQQFNILSSFWFKESTSLLPNVIVLPTCNHPLPLHTYHQQLYGVGIILQTLAIILVHKRLNLPVATHIFQLNANFTPLLSQLLPQSPSESSPSLYRHLMTSLGFDAAQDNLDVSTQEPTQKSITRAQSQSQSHLTDQPDVPMKSSLISDISTSLNTDGLAESNLKSTYTQFLFQLVQFMAPFQLTLIPKTTPTPGAQLQGYSHYISTQSQKPTIFPKQIVLPQNSLIDTIYAALNELIEIEQRCNTTATASLVSLEDESQQHRFKCALVKLVCEQIQRFIQFLQSPANLTNTNNSSSLECPHCIALQAYPILYSIFDFLIRERKGK